MIAKLLAALSFVVGLGYASGALADFSACDSAFRAHDSQQEITLWTSCLIKGGLPLQDRAGAFNNRGVAYERIGETDKAFNDFTWAIEADPRWATAYANRANVYMHRREWAKARADFEQGISVGPSDVAIGSYVGEVWLLAACPDDSIRDGHKAVELGLKAVRLSKKWPNAHDSLAMAYAEVGQFDDAIREESTAIELADPKAQAGGPALFQAHMEQFRKGSPVRL